MKKLIYLSGLAIFANLFQSANAQNVIQLTGNDCNGINHNLLADLDAGKAVILHFYMPNCGSCPPPAQKIQAMANRILTTHPAMITAYAMPYNNTSTCASTSSWVTTNNLSLYAPFDSGAAQVANYGGFGMPTVVLLGGTGQNKRVMFVTQSFSTSDTTIMRDSILNLFQSATGINTNTSSSPKFDLFPNPASNQLMINYQIKATAALNITLTDLNGKVITTIFQDKISAGTYNQTFDLSEISNGIYLVNFKLNEQSTIQKVAIKH